MFNDADGHSAAQRTSGARAVPYRNMAVLICRALPYQLCDLEGLKVDTRFPSQPHHRTGHADGIYMCLEGYKTWVLHLAAAWSRLAEGHETDPMSSEMNGSQWPDELEMYQYCVSYNTERTSVIRACQDMRRI